MAASKPVPSVLRGRNIGAIIIPIQEKKNISQQGRLAAGSVAVGGYAPAKPLSRIIFDKYDTDHSGHIDAEEFDAMVLELGYYLSPEQHKWAISAIDESGNGKIEYEEFIAWWKKDDRMKELQLDDDEIFLRAQAALIFRQFDVDLNGVIDKSEFPAFYDALLERQFTSLPREKCLANIDSSGDGHIQFNEFIRWLQKNKTEKVKTLLTDFLKSDDSEGESEGSVHTHVAADPAVCAHVLAAAVSHAEEKKPSVEESKPASLQEKKSILSAHVEEKKAAPSSSTSSSSSSSSSSDAAHHGPPSAAEKKVIAACVVAPAQQEKKPAVAAASAAASSAPSASLSYADVKARRSQLDSTRLESYLSDSEFVKVFGVSREEFNKKPQWKRTLMKKDAGLF